MHMTKGFLIAALATASTLALLVWAFLPEPVRVETAVVKEGAFRASFSEDGKTRLRNRYTVSAPFSGTVLRLSLKAGDKVSQGEDVATLFSAPSPLLDSRTKAELQERIGIAEANRDEATTLLESARMQSAEANREFERIKALSDSGTATRQQFDRAELAREVAARNEIAAEKRSHATEHMLEQARQLANVFGSTIREDQWKLTAPISGTVLKVYQESEAVVTSGTPLLDIGDLQDLEIVADILTTDSVGIEAGQKVLIENWGGTPALEGRVRLVEPAALTKVSALGIEEQRTPLVIDLISPTNIWSRLGDQYRVTVTVITEESDHALLVPTGAVFRRADGDYVFVANTNRAVLRAVQVGPRSHGAAVVLSGLNAGDTVILYPPRDLAVGAKIAPQ